MSKKSRQNRVKKQIPKWVYPSSISLLVILAFLIRTIPSWSKVFVEGMVWFRGVDSWHHMRLVDNMLANFPMPLRWDMFALYPEGLGVGYFPLMSWIIALPGFMFNHEVVGALLPPIMGALTLIPIYLICAKLWKPWVGLIACGLIAILPGEFLHRTLLGFTDHHVLEVFFMAWTVLFILLMQKERKLRWVILAGTSLGLYMASWAGSLLLVGIVWAWFLSLFIWKLARKEKIDRLCKDIGLVFGIALLLYLPNMAFIAGMVYFAGIMVLITASPFILLGLSKKLSWKWILGLIVCGLVGGGVFLDVRIPGAMGTLKAIIIQPGTSIQEAMPATPGVLIRHYGLALLLFLGGLGLAIKRKENLLIIVWGILMFLFAISQRRWGYYFTINVGLMAAFFTYVVYGWLHRQVKAAGVVVICAFLLATLLPSTVALANLPNMLTKDWNNACVWLRDNTPEIDGYYELDAEISYGVLSWWDYGNWITRIGRRAPISNPMAQTPLLQWQVLLARDEDEANEFLEGIDYILVDRDMVTGKAWAIVRLSPYDEIDWKPFMVQLWDEETTTWIKVFQEGGVKIFGRQEA